MAKGTSPRRRSSASAPGGGGTDAKAATEKVSYRWEKREFASADEKDSATGQPILRDEWVPVVKIPHTVIMTMVVGTGVPITTAAHDRLEDLVAGRILDAFGLADFGADSKSMFIPVQARPEADAIIKLAGSLLNAMERFDAKSDRAAEKRIDHWIEADCGASPRAVLRAVRETYSRYTPRVPDARKLSRAVFMADVRDQILARLVDDWASIKDRQRNSLLVAFLASLDEHVLRPLSRGGGVKPPADVAPALRGDRKKAISVALVNTEKSDEGLRKAITRELRRHDKEKAAVAARWAATVDRIMKRQADAATAADERTKLVE
jgi:hypothetical protein